MKIELADLEVEHEPTNRYITFPELEALVANERKWTLFYDIETGPAPEELVYEFFDEGAVKLPEHPGEFDPSKIKYGNTKDPKKKAEKLATEKAKHRQALASYDDDCRAAVDQAWNAFMEGAPLDPCIGRVLAIGYGIVVKGKEPLLLLDIEPGAEQNLLRRFWTLAGNAKRRNGRLVSFNGHFFDLPFMVARSWAHPDLPPLNFMTKYNKMEDFCVDVAVVYRQGRYGASGAIKLDKLAKMLGVRRKLEGVTGDMFHKLIKEDPERAAEYLELDILVLYDIARRMNIC